MRFVLAALLAKPRHPSKAMLLVRHFGGLALLPLAILDSSIIPTFGSLDLLTAWLAVATPDLWFYYAGMSTLGSLIGALLTYRMGCRLGTEWIAKKIGSARLHKLESSLQHWRFGAIFVSTIAPPPFPTSWFFLAAGAFRFPRSQLTTAVLFGRGLRYSLLTLIGAHYGRHFLRYLRHPAHYILISLIVTASLLAASWLFARRSNGFQAVHQPGTQNS